MKTCPRCKLELAFERFGRNISRTDGLQSHCKECRKSVNNEHYANSPQRRNRIRENAKNHRDKIRDYVNDYKKLHGCVICKENEPCAIDFHHVNGDKEVDVSRINSSLARIKKEIEKCVTLCANCHRKFHQGVINLP